MFWNDYPVWRSTTLNTDGVGHAFSTRAGGASRQPHTHAFNAGFMRGDSDETVRTNIKILCGYAGVSNNVIGTPQVHSADVRIVTAENIGEGITKDVPYPCDGFVTDTKGITLIVRVADCAPILLVGKKEDGTPVIGAAHAGWRGTAKGIALETVRLMRELGAVSIKAAIGPCIKPCCYEVGPGMKKDVADLRGEDFADRHIPEKNGKLYADIAGMNVELLREAGVEEIDVSEECTACKSWLYHSHRVTGGMRGTMGAVIGIK